MDIEWSEDGQTATLVVSREEYQDMRDALIDVPVPSAYLLGEQLDCAFRGENEF